MFVDVRGTNLSDSGSIPDISTLNALFGLEKFKKCLFLIYREFTKF